MEQHRDPEPMEHSPDAMHYSAEADGAPVGETVPDPVAHLEPAEAARVLGLAEGIDAEALAEALGGDGDGDEEECAKCSAKFTPSVLREHWCSEACQRAWQHAQVNEPDAVYFAGSAERQDRAMRGVAALFAFQYGPASV